MSVPIYLKKRNVSIFKAISGFRPKKITTHRYFAFAGPSLTTGRHGLLAAF